MRHFYKIVIVIGLLFSLPVSALENGDIAALPAIFKQNLVKPKVIIALDTSESMLTRAYAGKSFTTAETYDGYFNNKKCYKYQPQNGKGYFTEDGNYAAGCAQWSGNYLNWLSMRRVDIMRNILVGGTVKAIVGSNELSRRQVTMSGVKPTGFIVEGELITATERDYFTEDADLNLQGINSETPYSTSDKLHICHGRIVVTKNSTARTKDNLIPYCGASQPLPNDMGNAPTNTAIVDQYAVRLYLNSEPKGLLQYREEAYDFGVAVYQFDHNKSPDYLRTSSSCGKFDSNTNDCTLGGTIYRFNPFSGGTLQPCYPDVTKPILARTNYDICTETYAGAPSRDLIDVVEYYPLSAGQTAMAETLYEIGGYVKQTDHKRQTTGPQFYATGSTIGAYQLGSTIKPQWDPYYNLAYNKKVDCTKVFVININDGAPYDDFDTGTTHPSLQGLWADGENEELDAVVWSLRGDCRSDLNGQQEVKSFFVFADLSGNLDNVGARVVREGAAVSIANINYNSTTGQKSFTDSYFLSTSNPFNGANSTSTLDVLATTTGQSWDKNNDGNPDNFLLATSSKELQAALVNVLKAITREVAASSNASVVTQNSAGEGIIYQALMFPFLTDINNASHTVEWSGTVWGLFLDENGFYREDGNGNAKLDDYTTDPVIDYVEQDDGSAYFLRKKAVKDTNGNWQLQTLPGAKVTPLYFLKPIWSGANWLSQVNNTDATSQRNYNDAASYKRHILVGTKDLIIDGSGAAQKQQSFIASNFSATDAQWFGLDCEVITTTECEQTISNIVNYVRGKDDIDNARSRTLDLGAGNQRMLLGDIANSSPAVVAEPKETYDLLGDTSYKTFKEKYKQRRQMVYVGANDGMVHAFNGGFKDPRSATIHTSLNGETPYKLGAELWAYVPINVLAHLQFLMSPNYQHAFYVDGSPQVFDAKIFNDDADHPGGWGTVLAITMGFGGTPVSFTHTKASGAPVNVTLQSAMILLDVTNPEKPPVVLDEYTRQNTNYLLSTPTLIRDRTPSGVDWSSASNDWFLGLGNGPDNLQTGTTQNNARIFIYDLKNLSHKTTKTLGTNIKGYIGGITSADWQRIRGQGYKDDDILVTTVDGDQGDSGRLYRVNPNTFSIIKIFDAKKPLSSAGRAFYGAGTQWLFLGSGKYNTSVDNTSIQQQRFWGLKIPTNFTQKINSTALINTSGINVKKNKSLNCTSGCPTLSTGIPAVTFNELKIAMNNNAVSGWYLDINNAGNSIAAGEPSGRVIGKAAMANEILFFTSFTPTPGLCEEGGNSQLYALDFLTGTSPDFSVFGGDANDTTYAAFIDLGEGAVREVVINASANSDQGIVDIHTVNSRAELKRTEANVKSIGTGRVSWRELFYE